MNVSRSTSAHVAMARGLRGLALATMAMVSLALVGCGQSAAELAAEKSAQLAMLTAQYQPLREQHVKAVNVYMDKQREMEKASFEVRRLKGTSGDELVQAKAALNGLESEYLSLKKVSDDLLAKRTALENKMKPLGWKPVLVNPDAVGGTPRPEGS